MENDFIVPEENLSFVFGSPGTGKTEWAEQLSKNPNVHHWQYRTWYEAIRDGFNHSPWEKKVSKGDTIIFDEVVLRESGKLPDLLHKLAENYKVVLLTQENPDIEGVPSHPIWCFHPCA